MKCLKLSLILDEGGNLEMLADRAYGLTFKEYMRCIREGERLRKDLLKDENASCVFELIDLQEKFKDASKQYATMLNRLAEKSLGGNLRLF